MPLANRGIAHENSQGATGLARFTWLFPKKRGLRRTGSKLAGLVGEAAFFLALFLIGCAGSITLVWSYFARTWPVEDYFPTVHYVQTDGVVTGERTVDVKTTDGAPRREPQVRVRYTVGERQFDRWTSAGEASLPEGEAQPLWYDPDDPARITLTNPTAWGLWLICLLAVAMAASGAYGVISTALQTRTSAERRAALSQAAKARIDLSESQLPPSREFPTVPRDVDLLSSPGVRLKYRLPASHEPAWRLFAAAVWMLTCGALAAALAVVAIEQYLAGQPRWLLAGFAVLVVALTSWAIYCFLRELVSATWMGPTSVEISDLPLLPGSAYQVYFHQPGALSVRRLRVLLACDEETTYLQGTDIRHDVQRVYQEELFCRQRFEIDAAQPLEQNCPLVVPPAAMHSYKSNFNALNWKLVVEIDADGWPVYRRSYPLLIYPSDNSAGRTDN